MVQVQNIGGVFSTIYRNHSMKVKKPTLGAKSYYSVNMC